MKDKKYTPVIGLEIHVQLATKSKMFDRVSADWFGKKPNTVVGPVALGLPGALPVPNKKAIQWAILVGMALNCKTSKISKFDRKHYFYPDLPKGYQISQYDQPFSYDGYYEFTSKSSGEKKRIGITRAHLEEDTGKLIHKGEETLVDFNRSGVPLLEIVTEPDFDNSDDVKQFLEELRVIVRYLGVSEANMERGSMRLEPNISVKKAGTDKLPDYKVEVKNINSFRYAKLATDFEIKRHIKLLEKGETPAQETRGWNESKNATVSQRIKEEAADYRYFPEPDVPPFVLGDDFIDEIRDMMTELPHERMKKYVDMGVTEDNAYVLTRSRKISKYFEKVLEALGKNEELKFKSKTLAAEVAKLLVNKKIQSDFSPEDFVLKVKEILTPTETNTDQLEEAINNVVENNPEPVEQFKSGKENVIMFLVGQVMKEMRGQADAQMVRSELEKKLS